MNKIPNKKVLTRPTELNLSYTLPSVYPRLCAYSCAIELRLMFVGCPLINRTTTGQQPDNNRRNSEGKTWVERH
jgi:hypothetical protein